MEQRHFNIGLLLIFFLWDIFFVSTLFYIMGISTMALTLLLAIVSCIYILGRYLKIKEIKEILFEIMLVLVLILVPLLFCISVFDVSWDGNNYQKAIVGLLEYGWNPIYMTFDDAANISGLFSINQWSTWFDAYPKASSIIAAVFYAFVGNIEAGKAYTIISCIAGIFIVRSYLNELTDNAKIKLNSLISMALFVNPISVSQCVTFYNDAFLWNTLFITFFACMYLTVSKKQEYNKQSWLLIFLCMGLGLNIKFSALIYFTLICGGFYFYWIYRIVKIEKRKIYYKKITAFFVLTFLFSVCILGATSYVKNTILHHNPVYTMIGANKSEIIDSESPIVLKTLSRGERFFVSLFSESSNDKNIEDLRIKLPLTIDEKEKDIYWVDARIGGWGVFFSGILLISLVSLALVYKKLDIFNKSCLILLLLFAFIPTCVIPGLFWARYWMILFIIPCFTMYLLSLQSKTGWISLVLLVLSFGNIVSPLIQVYENISVSQQTKLEYLTLAGLAEEKKLTVKLGVDEFIFNGLVFNLQDYEIKNYYLDNHLLTEKNISAGCGRVFYEVTEPNHET